jgi:hypothetical protein
VTVSAQTSASGKAGGVADQCPLQLPVLHQAELPVVVAGIVEEHLGGAAAGEVRDPNRRPSLMAWPKPAVLPARSSQAREHPGPDRAAQGGHFRLFCPPLGRNVGTKIRRQVKFCLHRIFGLMVGRPLPGAPLLVGTFVPAAFPAVVRVLSTIVGPDGRKP